MLNELRDLDFNDIGSAPTSVRYVILAFLLIIILVIIVIIFGAGKLPEIGSGIGKGIRNFKEATKKEEENAKKIDDEKKDDSAA